MNRNHYKIFSEGRIGSLTLPNRLVRSATWDPSILLKRKMNDETIALYRRVAAGGVGMIITGDFSALPNGSLENTGNSPDHYFYEDVRIEGYDLMIAAVREAAPNCKIIAQISAEYPNVSPSGILSPFAKKAPRILTSEQITAIIQRFAVSIEGAMNDGFDGIQIHAAHGGLLSKFLSPYTNRRTDAYGGSVLNRVNIIAEIISAARKRVGDFPIFIKLNCTDYVEGGTDIDNFPESATEVEKAGVDAIETSGGLRDCLVRPEEELGFPPVYPPESQTRIARPERQSYFLKYVEKLRINVPVILVGGNRDVELLENITQQGAVDFISLCRPLISEPNLPHRWREGQGKSGTDCKSCNSCIYDQMINYGKDESNVARCVLKEDPQQVKTARKWLTSFSRKKRTCGSS
jgi:2,4-dienoyl-CoA reductase-like NADH-dependent reductase (Old Yellow Enzyme family)